MLNMKRIGVKKKDRLNSNKTKPMAANVSR
jgi:hypothetical protein